MQIHLKTAPLFLCLALLAGLASPALAGEGPDGAVRYHAAEPPSHWDVYLLPGTSFEDLRYELSFGGEDLYPEDGGEALYFETDWSVCLEDYERAAAAGETALTLTAGYRPGGGWPEADLARWEAGLIQIDPGSLVSARIFIRPDDMRTIYRPDGEPPACTVEPGTPLAQAGLPEEITLYQQNSPYEYGWCDFSVSWNPEVYAAGMERGGSFTLTGSYTGCLREAYAPLWEQGLLVTEGPPSITILVAQQLPPAETIYYEDYADPDSGPAPNTYLANLARGAPFQALDTSGLEFYFTELGLEGDGAYKRFAVQWDEAEYAAGMAGGASTFTVHGTYVPDTACGGTLPYGWKPYELRWWDQGLIRVAPSTPAPLLNVRVVEPGQALPFRVSLVARYGGLVPKFEFPAPNGADRVVCACSPDGETWYEAEVEPYEYDSLVGEVAFYLLAYDGEGGLIQLSADAPSYYRMRVEGSAYAGETSTLVLNAPPDAVLPDGSTDGGTGDDGGGDIDERGGGGQGEHARPGKEEEPGPTPEPEPPAQPVQPPASADAAGEEGGPTPAPVPTPRAPQRTPQPDAGPAADRIGEAPQVEPALAASAGTRPPSPATSPAAEEAQAPAPAPAGEPAAPGASAPNPVRIPGFALATAATAAVILAAAAWLRRRGNRR